MRDGVEKPAGSAVYWPVMMDNFEGQKEGCDAGSRLRSAARGRGRRLL